MVRKLHVLLGGALLIATSPSAVAQGTYPSGVRSGYTGTASGSSTPTTAATGTSSSPAPATRNLGTGQGRTEGAMGFTPQLQKELGIGRQQ